MMVRFLRWGVLPEKISLFGMVDFELMSGTNLAKFAKQTNSDLGSPPRDVGLRIKTTTNNE